MPSLSAHSEFEPISVARSKTKYSLTTFLAVFGVYLLLIIAAMIIVGAYKVEKLRIGGNLYEQIIDGKDLVADVLPPPLYIIEAFLEAHDIRDNPQKLNEGKRRLTALRSEYNSRLAHWQKSNLPNQIKEALAASSHSGAGTVWDELEKNFIPAVERRDNKAIQASMQRMDVAFQEHKEAIAKVVSDANAYLKEKEAAGAEAGSQLIYLAVFISGVFVFSIISLGWFARAMIISPLIWLMDRMTGLAAGDLATRIDRDFRVSQVAGMTQALVRFQANAIDKKRIEQEAEKANARAELEDAARRKREAEIANERSTVLAAIGSGMSSLAMKDLSFRLTGVLPEAFSELQSDFNNAIQQMENAMKSVRNSTDALTSGTNEISIASDDLSRRTESQAASLEQTAAALDEITTRVRKAADGAQHAREVVAEARSDAETSGDIVRKAVDAMSKIEKSSQEIANIISVIDEIAFQTNLLALNAGVEAARAGDAGRGFAVVASEVRALAQRSAEAAKEIKTLITMSNGEVGQGVKLVAQTGDSLERIVAKVSKINTAVVEISASAQEQALALQEINSAVNQMDQMTQQNAAMAEQATAAAQSLAQESGQLAALVNEFRTGDKHTDSLRSELKKAAPHAFRGAAEASPRAHRALRRAVGAHPGAKVASASHNVNDDWQEF